jgi:hypothetical protein
MGNDVNKKISGIKRHIAVDTQGFPRTITLPLTACVGQ